MREYHIYTPEDDKIICQEIGKSFENILAGCCAAAARIFKNPDLKNLIGKEAVNNSRIKSVYRRWYVTVSFKNANRPARVLYMAHNRNKASLNRKVAARGRQLLVPIVSVPNVIHKRATQELKSYLGKDWNSTVE